MAKFSRILVAILFIGSINAQTENQRSSKKTYPVGESCGAVMAEIADLFGKTRSLFIAKKFDEAFPLAKKMSDIAEANCYAEKDKRLTLAVNVAEIQINRKKLDSAREIYEANLDLAEEVFGIDSREFEDYLDALVKVSVYKVSNKKIEEIVLKRLEVKKKVYGAESYEAVRDILRMGTFLANLKEFEKAEQYFLEAIEINNKFHKDEKIQQLRIETKYQGYLIKRFGDKEGVKRAEAFMKIQFEKIPVSERSSNILNGMALKLVKPQYPSDAFVAKVRGKVEVGVTIGEDGKVIAAKAISGHPFLRLPAEQAAKQSLFTITFLEGSPVKVTGKIVYVF